MRTLALVVIGALLLTSVALGAPPGPPVTRAFTLTAQAFACPADATLTCYGYNGSTPGPTLDVNVGDELDVTLVNHLAENVSFHVHGMVLSVANDGIPAHAGAQFPDSSVAPGAQRTYHFRAAYAGVWHYHDHTIGYDGAQGVRNGLFGTVVVRSGGDVRPATIVDLHVLDASANASRPNVVAHAPLGLPFEVDATVLGNDLWSFTASDPVGTVLLPRATLGPATSQRWSVAAAAPGTYVWHADGRYFDGHVTGKVIVP